MPRKGSTADVLLEDEDIRRWHENLARGSRATADINIRRLAAFCTAVEITPAGLTRLDGRDYVSGPGRPWSFLTDGTGLEGGVVPSGSAVQAPSISSDSDLSRVHLRVKQLLAQGKTEATLQDFADLFGGGEGGFLERQRLGMALVALGAKSRRIRTGDGQERVYDISQLADSTDSTDRGRGEDYNGKGPGPGTNN